MALPFLVAQLINVRDKYDERRQSVLQSQMATAQAIAAVLDSFVIDALRTDEVAGLALTGKSFSSDEISQYLALVRQQHPSMLYLAFIPGQGLPTSVDPPSFQSLDFQNQRDIAAIINGKDWAASNLQLGNDQTGEVPIFSVSVGLRIDGKLEGIVQTCIKAGSLASVITSSVAGDSAVVVTDSSGLVVFDSLHPNLSWDKRDWSGVDVVRQALTRQNGLTDGLVFPADGVRRLGSQAPVSSIGWTAGAYRPVDEALAPVRESSIRDLVVLGISLVITLSLVRLLGVFLTRPLLKLTAHAERLGKGDLSQTIAISARDETGQLAAVFNQMSHNLANTINELTQAKEEVSQKTRQLEQLLSRTNQLQEEERKRIAFDIHDGVLQLMTAADYETQAAGRSLASHPETAAGRIATARQRISEAIAEMRRVIFDLHPTHLESAGLVPALQKYAARLQQSTGLPCEVTFNGPAFTISEEVAGSVYRIVQEAAFNVVKHAKATRMEIAVEAGGDSLRIAIEDNGQGFLVDDPEISHAGHLGLISMAQRAESVGGRLEIKSSASGTTVSLEVPVTALAGANERG